jgi:calcium-dependent secretion activator
MNAVRDGESVLMGVTDENECHLWVMALYRATGQSHKPTPPTTSDTHHKIMGGEKQQLVICKINFELN